MLEAIAANASREKLMAFPVLQPEDHQIIGFFIQQFNYMDLNFRRAIETFHYDRLFPDKAAKKYPKIHSSEVVRIVQDSIEATVASRARSNAVK